MTMRAGVARPMSPARPSKLAARPRSVSVEVAVADAAILLGWALLKLALWLALTVLPGLLLLPLLPGTVVLAALYRYTPKPWYAVPGLTLAVTGALSLRRWVTPEGY